MIQELPHGDFDPNGFETYPDNDFGPKRILIQKKLIMIPVQNIQSNPKHIHFDLNHLIILVEK